MYTPINISYKSTPTISNGTYATINGAYYEDLYSTANPTDARLFLGDFGGIILDSTYDSDSRVASQAIRTRRQFPAVGFVREPTFSRVNMLSAGYAPTNSPSTDAGKQLFEFAKAHVFPHIVGVSVPSWHGTPDKAYPIACNKVIDDSGDGDVNIDFDIWVPRLFSYFSKEVTSDTDFDDEDTVNELTAASSKLIYEPFIYTEMWYTKVFYNPNGTIIKDEPVRCGSPHTSYASIANGVTGRNDGLFTGYYDECVHISDSMSRTNYTDGCTIEWFIEFRYYLKALSDRGINYDNCTTEVKPLHRGQALNTYAFTRDVVRMHGKKDGNIYTGIQLTPTSLSFGNKNTSDAKYTTPNLMINPFQNKLWLKTQVYTEITHGYNRRAIQYPTAGTFNGWYNHDFSSSDDDLLVKIRFEIQPYFLLYSQGEDDCCYTRQIPGFRIRITYQDWGWYANYGYSNQWIGYGKDGRAKRLPLASYWIQLYAYDTLQDVQQYEAGALMDNSKGVQTLIPSVPVYNHSNIRGLLNTVPRGTSGCKESAYPVSSQALYRMYLDCTNIENAKFTANNLPYWEFYIQSFGFYAQVVTGALGDPLTECTNLNPYLYAWIESYDMLAGSDTFCNKAELTRT